MNEAVTVAVARLCVSLRAEQAAWQAYSRHVEHPHGDLSDTLQSLRVLERCQKELQSARTSLDAQLLKGPEK